MHQITNKSQIIFSWRLWDKERLCLWGWQRSGQNLLLLGRPNKCNPL